jgi:hypothetical protein
MNITDVKSLKERDIIYNKEANYIYVIYKIYKYRQRITFFIYNTINDTCPWKNTASFNSWQRHIVYNSLTYHRFHYVYKVLKKCKYKFLYEDIFYNNKHSSFFIPQNK